MATQLQLRRGTTTEQTSFTGAVGEVTLDTTKNVLVVHDGTTAGGFPQATKANADGTISLIKKDGTRDGEIFDTKKLYRKQQKNLKQFQRRLSRKKKGSNNRNKAKKKLNKLHYKIKCKRRDYTHKTSSSITKNYKFICVEDLNIKGMSKNRKLSKSILDQGLSMFVQQLEYKSRNNGRMTVKIDRFAPSTKTCHHCDHKQTVSLNEGVYNCESCGLVMNRDLNAAINIKRWALS